MSKRNPPKPRPPWLEEQKQVEEEKQRQHEIKYQRAKEGRKRELLTEIHSKQEGYCGEFLRSGQRSSRLDYVLEELEINKSLSIRETVTVIEESWK